MWTFNQRILYIYCINVAMLAIGIFLHGFFPVKTVKRSFASTDDIPMELGSYWLNPDEYIKIRRVDKLVIMIVDAIRFDFVRGNGYGTNMPYTDSHIKKKKSCLFKLTAEPPTVTMPRIKAITSGSVSTFIDILINFGSTEMLVDNFIDQAKNKYNIVFYGDDTWLKLFPERFIRSEGTTSFFVSDYTQVDLNVTRNMKAELKRNDWDIMILHYLGLDHIGHLEGPKSKLIKPKLKEMDDIIKEIHNHLLNLEKKSNKSTLLMVLGDHGMADAGSHGGTTVPEIEVPLVTFGLGCGGARTRTKLPQVSVAPTLSLLFGLPIPADNVGQVITRLLYSFSSHDILYMLYYNSYQVVAQYLQYGGTILDDCYKNYWKAQHMHMDCLRELPTIKRQHNSSERYLSCSVGYVRRVIKTYCDALQHMTSHLLKSVVDFNMLEIIVSIIILMQLLLITAFDVTFKFSSRKRLRNMSTFIFFIMFISCWSNILDLSCCFSSKISMAVTAILIIIMSLNFELICNSQISSIYKTFKIDSVFDFLAYFGTVILAVSMVATSLIEQENFVWYHLFLLFLVVTVIDTFRESISKLNFLEEQSLNTAILSILKCGLKRNMLHYYLLFVIHRILRNYGHFYSGWLSNQENIKVYLSGICILGLIFVWKCCINGISRTLNHKTSQCVQFLDKILIASCVFIIYYYRAITGTVVLPFMFQSHNSGANEVKLFFILVFISLILKTFIAMKYALTTKSDEKNFFLQQCFGKLLFEGVFRWWMLTSSLLLRPQHIWLLPVHVYTCKVLSSKFNNIMCKTIMYHWIGMVFYFYQGNSNQIISIDITAGYVGQTDYNVLVASLLITIHTFCFPVLSFLVLMTEIFKGDQKTNITKVYRAYLLILLTQLSSYTLIITFQRYHLFIWSVFSPKLLYLASHCIIITCLYWFTETVLMINQFLILVLYKYKDNLTVVL